MIELKGKYGEAKVFTDNLEDGSKFQIKELLNQDFIKNDKIRVMPDVHQGMGCVIGFTSTMHDKVVPNIVGVDIGCGMLTVKLGKVEIDLEKLDKIIYNKVPAGRNIHNKEVVKFPKLNDLYSYGELKNIRRIKRSIGTLGGGNHFIELGEDSNNCKYLIIHSGSRNLGNQVARYYQKIAIDVFSGLEGYYNKKLSIIRDYQNKGLNKKINKKLKKLKNEYKKRTSKYPKNLCYLKGEYKDRYLYDMNICQEYASLNRIVMADIILYNLLGKKLKNYDYFETVHNYINFNDKIIRKGAISAHKGEIILIPINMRDGSILARGKGNSDWNYSAPHGAGRILSRSEAKEILNMEEFKKDMEGVYSTSINRSTLDESPKAYKPIEEIIKNLDETAEVLDIIRPIYNFKA